MRRYSFPLIALTLAMLLMAGLTRAEESKTCQKSMTGTAVGCEKKCAAEKACAKAGGMSSADTGCLDGGKEGCHGGGSGTKGCAGSEGCHASGGHGAKDCGGPEGCHGSGGCHAMKAGGAGHGMMDMHRGMMTRGGRSARRHGRRMGLDSHGPGGPGHFVRMAELLELTDKQIEDLKALRRDHEKAAIEMRADIALIRVDMKELLDQESIDFGKIKAKVAQIADLHKKMRLARWTLMEKSHDLLTTEQMEKAEDLRKQGQGPMMESRRQMIKKMIIEDVEE